MPGPAGWLFIYIFGCFLFARPLLLLWEGGICRHLTTGQHFVNSFTVPGTNYVSALFPNVPCLTHSFLGDVIFGYADWMFGLNGIVAAVSAAIAVSLMWSYQLARARGMGAITGLVLVALVLAACSVHWTARPLVFSYLTFLGLYYVTFMSSMSDRARLAMTAVIMVLWVNLHGSFLLGLLMLGVKFAVDFWQAAWTKGCSKRPVFIDLAAMGAAALAICANLRGFGFYMYVIEYLQHPMILFKSNEWRSLDFSLGFQTWSFLILFVLVVCSWALAGKRQSPHAVLLTCALFLLGVHTMRMVPYFALCALPAMASSWHFIRQQLLSGEEEQADAGWLQRLCVRFFRFEQRIEEKEFFSWKPVMLQGAVATAVLLAFLLGPQFRINDFDPKRMPVQAANFLEKQHLQDRLGFVYDNWGGYLYWRFRKPIFIDDWTDFYPIDFLHEYVATITAESGWNQVLDKYQIDFALIPKDCLLSNALASDAGWKRAYQDDCSDLFVRTPLAANFDKRISAGEDK